MRHLYGARERAVHDRSYSDAGPTPENAGVPVQEASNEPFHNDCEWGADEEHDPLLAYAQLHAVNGCTRDRFLFHASLTVLRFCLVEA